MPSSWHTSPLRAGGSAAEFYVPDEPQHPAPESEMGFRSRTDYRLTAFVLLRGLGVIYCFAFLSLLNQWRGLFGSTGLLPAARFLERVETQIGSKTAAFWQLPSVFWLSVSDRSLAIGAVLGLILALALALGFANGAQLLALYVLYLSFVQVGQIFYGYGWESLLCEAGLLAVFLVPFWRVRAFQHAVPLLVVILFRWLAFRVMFGAGLIKIRGDSCWRDLSCLYYHFETQPLPNPLSPWFHALPHGLLRAGTGFNHFAELVAPFGVFGPRRVRYAAGCTIILFQFVLILSGNLSFLNWLTIVVAIACFDDAFFKRWFGWGPLRRLSRYAGLALPPAEPLSRWRARTSGALAVVVGLLSLNPIANMLSTRQRMNASFDPFRVVNTYGAFGSVSTSRFEVVIEGTRDLAADPNAVWQEYELPCKPGAITRRPCVAAPYQYRLDWQLWFAAFDSYPSQPWVLQLVYQLLRNNPEVTGLFAKNPFSEHPPRYVRILYYRYRFASASANTWWQRSLEAEYLPAVALDHPGFERALRQLGWWQGTQP